MCSHAWYCRVSNKCTNKNDIFYFLHGVLLAIKSFHILPHISPCLGITLTKNWEVENWNLFVFVFENWFEFIFQNSIFRNHNEITAFYGSWKWTCCKQRICVRIRDINKFGCTPSTCLTREHLLIEG